MNSASRRSVLAMSTGALAALAGCTTSSPDECSPASFPEDTSTRTREEPPSVCQYGAELESRGMDVDSTMGSPGVSVMYFREPDSHREQIRTVAVAFVPYRRMVESGKPLSFTALESNDNRHGTGYVAREWADRRARSELSSDEYVKKVMDTYGTR